MIEHLEQLRDKAGALIGVTDPSWGETFVVVAALGFFGWLVMSLMFD